MASFGAIVYKEAKRTRILVFNKRLPFWEEESFHDNMSHCASFIQAINNHFFFTLYLTILQVNSKLTSSLSCYQCYCFKALTLETLCLNKQTSSYWTYPQLYVSLPKPFIISVRRHGDKRLWVWCYFRNDNTAEWACWARSVIWITDNTIVRVVLGTKYITDTFSNVLIWILRNTSLLVPFHYHKLCLLLGASFQLVLVLL